MGKWPGRKGLECRVKGFGLETPVRHKEALEVGVGVVDSTFLIYSRHRVEDSWRVGHGVTETC